jgi:hypothetical protein
MDNNVKKILCLNILNKKECVYGNNCIFAHSLEEQNKDKYKNMIINFIKNNKDLSKINLMDDIKLFNELMVFTNKCEKCLNKKCSGGYNCKYGVCNLNLLICRDDLLNGNCCNECMKDENHNMRCINGIHLTYKKLIPFNINKIIRINGKNIKTILLNDTTIDMAINLINTV